MSIRFEEFEQPKPAVEYAPKHLTGEVIGKSALSGELEWDITNHNHPTMVDSGHKEGSIEAEAGTPTPKHIGQDDISKTLDRMAKIRRNKTKISSKLLT